MSTLKVNTIQTSAGAAFPIGKVLQYVHMTDTNTASTNSSSFQDSNFSLNITPSSSSNKIVVTGNVVCTTGGGSTDGPTIRLLRTVSGGSGVAFASQGDYGIAGHGTDNYSMSNYAANGFYYIDTPNTTSQVNYKIQYRTWRSTCYFNWFKYRNAPCTGSFVLMELSA